MKYLNDIDKKICAQVLSWEAHLPFIESCFASVKKLNIYTIMAWDIKHATVPISNTFPPSSVMSKVDVFLRKPAIPMGSGVVVPFIIQNYLTIPIIEKIGFDSVFSLSGDIHIAKPENFDVVYEMFKPYDLMPYWYSEAKIGTMIYFIKTKALRLIFDWVVEKFDTYGPVEAERMVMDAVKYYDLKYPKFMKRNYNYNLLPGQPDIGVLCETLGIRHIQYEHKKRMALNQGVDTKFVNLNFNGEKKG